MRIYETNNGLTVKELKEIIGNWPDDGEVWVGTGAGLSSPVVRTTPLNKRTDGDGMVSADILFETNAFK